MGATRWIAALFPTLLVAPPVAFASDVDTQFIFGFTQGTDVGELGEREIESETTARLGKGDGSYTGLTSQLRYEMTPLEDFRFEAGVLATYHSISGVSGFDDRSGVQFGGFALEARYRLLDRRSAPFGLTIGVEPHWMHLDETSGEVVTNYGSEFRLALEKEPVDNRVFVAFNFIYDPEWTHLEATGVRQRQSTLGLSAALTIQVEEGIFVGAEVHYLREYDGIGFDVFNGDALFIGPTMYARLSKNFSMSAAWSVQIAGQAIDIPGSLNLRDFERHQVRLRFEYTF